MFARNLGVKVMHVDAAARSSRQLAGVTTPSRSARSSAAVRRGVPARGRAKLANAKWLAQGTIYPDVIESAAARPEEGAHIKSHHNVGGLPETLNLKLLEPLRELFKDEVRELGRARPAARDGLPPPVPRPGPRRAHPRRGEADTPTCCAEADAIFIEELRAPAGTTRPAQAFAVFLPVRRSASWATAAPTNTSSRCARSRHQDFMTAHWAHLPLRLLGGLEPHHQRGARHQPRRLRHLGKPPATIEWE
jgi:GMP synthase (glutamine-hydrolysing)